MNLCQRKRLDLVQTKPVTLFYSPYVFSSPKEYYRKIYYEFADSIRGELEKDSIRRAITCRYMDAERLLLSAAGTGEVINDNLQKVCEHFGEDFDHSRLKNKLHVLSDLIPECNPSLRDIQNSVISLNTAKGLFSEVLKLLQLLYVIPASTASAERSFSSLRRVKTYLRNAMNASRLNHLMILHEHKHKTDELYLNKIAEEFIARNDKRKYTFGTIQ